MSTKTENAEKARRWRMEIEDHDSFCKYISNSLKNTKVVQDTLLSHGDMRYIKQKAKLRKEVKSVAEVIVNSRTTYEELKRQYDDKMPQIGVLNFASYFNPGGGFTKGAIAQEESLCHVSGLYEILRNLPVYEERKAAENIPAEYRSELIYSPMVPFTMNEGSCGPVYLVDVVSCAAPNCNRIPISRLKEYYKILKHRIEAIYCMPYIEGCTKVILGAWGCGVFKNDPNVVARMFNDCNNRYGVLYDEVIYAIPNDKMEQIFAEVFRKGEVM